MLQKGAEYNKGAQPKVWIIKASSPFIKIFKTPSLKRENLLRIKGPIFSRLVQLFAHKSDSVSPTDK